MSDPKTGLTASQQARLLAGLKHLTPETILAYAQQKITKAAELKRVESHLFSCDACLTEYNRAFDAYSPLKADFDAFHSELTQAMQEADTEADSPEVIGIDFSIQSNSPGLPRIDFGTGRTQATQESEKGRLVAALEQLASVSETWKARLIDWRDRLMAAGVSEGVALNALVVSDLKTRLMRVLPDLSAPGLDVAVAGAGWSTRRGGPDDDDPGISLVLVTDGLDVAVTLGTESVRLEFAKWSSSEDPLVVLVPEDAFVDALLPSSFESDGSGEVVVLFEGVPSGAYLISIAPASL